MNKSKVFEVYEDYRKRIFTVNLTPGKKVYDELLVTDKGIEYREWNPRKSKLAAAILKGSNNVFIRKGSVVLYLGCASGTTPSHVSDIVGKEGFIFALDFAPRVVRDIVFVAEDNQKNIGFVTGVLNTKRFYGYFLQNNLLKIAIYLAPKIFDINTLRKIFEASVDSR